MTIGNEQPQFPERDPVRLERLLGQEIGAAQSIIGTEPWDVIPEVIEGWGRDTRTAEAFQRGRLILQSISYANTYWQADFELDMGMEASGVFDDRSGLFRMVTERLLQVVALSRVPVGMQNGFPAPSLAAMRDTLDEMRAELGVTEEFERIADTGQFTIPAFPGIDNDRLVQAILDGQLGIGNPDQPYVAYGPETGFPTPPRPAAGGLGDHDDSMDGAIQHIIETMGDGNNE